MSGLKGAWFAIYRTLWVVLFVAGVASLLYVNPRDQARSIRLNVAAHALGFHPYLNEVAEGLLGGAYGDEGRRIGLRDGDVLLTVDGRAIPSEIAGQTALLDGPPGGIVTLGARHADGARFTVRVARDPGIEARAYAGSGTTYSAQRWMSFAIATLATAASLVAAALLFLRRPRDRVAQLLSAALVAFNIGLTALWPGVPAIVGQLGYELPAVALWLAVLLFPNGRFATRWHVIAFLAVVANVGMNLAQWARSSFSAWHLVASLIPWLLILLAIVQQLRRTLPGTQRQQTKFVLFGVAAYCLFLIAATVLLPFEFMSLNAATTGWIIFVKRTLYASAAVALPAGLLVSLLRYRLYDAETAISRSVAYGALTVSLVAVFAGSQKVIEMLGEGYFGGQLGALASALAAAVAAGTIAPLHGRVTRWAERRFQGDLVHLRTGLPLLVGDLRETASPAALADAMLLRLEQGVRATHGAVVAGGAVIAARHIDADAVGGWLAARGGAPSGSALEADRADPLFPLRVPLHADGVGLVGALLLGPRPDGSFYGKDERETLAAIADPVARALAIAIERERRECERRQRDTAAERTLDALCRFVQERFGVDLRGARADAT